MNLAIIFAFGLFTSAITGRVATLAWRGGVRRPLNPVNAVRDIVSIVSSLSFWALILWGFSTLDWYVVIAVAIVAGMAGGLIANPPRWGFLYRFQAGIGLLALRGAGWASAARRA